MPQINDSFIDRLIQLTAASADIDFRKQLAEEYRTASLAVVPLQQAVAYDRSIVEIVRGGGGSSTGLTRDAIAKEIAQTCRDVRQLAASVHEIHGIVSRNLNPSTELIRAGAAFTRIGRAVSPKRLALWRFLVCAVAFAVAVVASLFHSRVRAEDAANHGALQDPDA